MIRSMNVAWWIHRWASIHPAKPALIFEDREISYRELHQRANRAAVWLQELGIEKGDRVALFSTNCPEFIELYLACARLGAIFVPLNFRLTAPELDYHLRDSRPRLLVFHHLVAGSVEPLDLAAYRPPLLTAVIGPPPADGQTLDFRGQTEALDGRRPFVTDSLGPADPEEPQVIMYTSGTTGRPKGAVLSHRKTFFNCLNADIFFRLHFEDVMLILLPLFHSGGLFIMASPSLYKGATIILHPRFDPNKAYADIERHQVTKFLGVPTVFRSLLGVEPGKRGDLSSLKVCAIGGEKTTPELLARCREAGFSLRQIMGQTETSILLWASEEASLQRSGTVGRPVFHAEVKLLGEDGREVEPGQVGEIVARGSILMKEYWRDPVKTERTMRGGWLRTGDLARQDEDGFFYLVDRARDLYISGGENVYPAEVERVLKEHPKIRDVAVVAVPHQTWGEVGHAFVIPRDQTRPDLEEIRSFCRGRLAAFKWPQGLTLVEEFPRTPLGKVRKFLLLQESGRQEG